jgi:hypothetical protein
MMDSNALSRSAKASMLGNHRTMKMLFEQPDCGAMKLDIDCERAGAR